ncbi:large conductance mechanosensitive channel protein MscL, partial [[Kitasatospora] papulosa]
AKVQNRFAKEEAVDIKAALRDCPRCFSEIPAVASRCGHCTSEVEPDPEALSLAKLPAQQH